MSGKKTTTLRWICRTVTHYNTYLFDAIDKQEGIDLEVNYTIEKRQSHPWKTEQLVTHKRRFYDTNFGLDWTLILKGLKSNRDTLYVIGSWSDPSVIVLILILSILKKRFVIWTDSPNVSGSYKGLLGKIRSRWISFVFTNAKKVMGTGEKAIENLKFLNCPDYKLINLPYFTNNEIFNNVNAHKLEEKIILISSGRLVNERKAFDHVIKAISRIIEKNPSIKLEYRIAGIGKDLESLKSLALSLNVQDYVFFDGWLEPQELTGFYNLGDIYVHPAKYEPYGVAVLEAMASGLAIIGSNNTGAIVDRIDHGVNGFIFKTGNINELKERISDLINDKELLLCFKERSRFTANQWPVSKGVQIVNGLI